MAAAGPPGLLHLRRGGPTGPLGDHRPLLGAAGGPPYHPRMMVKVLLYGYCTGVPSSRRIAKRLHEDIAFRVLAANNTPDFRTVSDFRKDHLAALSGLFLQVLALCQRAGLVKAGPRGAGRHQGQSQRLQAQGDELPAYEGEGGAVGVGGGGVAAPGRGGG